MTCRWTSPRRPCRWAPEQPLVALLLPALVLAARCALPSASLLAWRPFQHPPHPTPNTQQVGAILGELAAAGGADLKTLAQHIRTADANPDEIQVRCVLGGSVEEQWWVL